MLRALRESSCVKNAIRSPSSAIQIGTLCGPPSGSTVAMWAKFGPSSSARTLSGSSAMRPIVACQDAPPDAPAGRDPHRLRARGPAPHGTCASSRTRSRRTRATLPAESPPAPDLAPGASDEERAAFGLQLNAVNFGSGWFPTLRKPAGLSGFRTVEAGLKARGPWTAEELTPRRRAPRPPRRSAARIPTHPLMALFAPALRELGEHVARRARRLVPRARPLAATARPSRSPSTWRDLPDLVRRLALRRRAGCRSSSAPSSPPPTCTCRGSRPRATSPR